MSYYVLFIFLFFIVVVLIIVLLATFFILIVVVASLNSIVLVVVGCGSWSADRRAGRRYVILVDFGLRVEWLIVRAGIAVVVAGHDVYGVGGKSGALE
jgi:hypothetical protein